jgi:hypothetical protein
MAVLRDDEVVLRKKKRTLGEVLSGLPALTGKDCLWRRWIC